ncbi:hypothetical protein [Corynebacterium macginleyi]
MPRTVLIALCILLAVLAVAGVLGSRVWLLRRIKEAAANNERPCDHEGTYR